MTSTIWIVLLITSFTFAQNGGETASDVRDASITKLDLSKKGLTSLNDYDFSKYPLLEEIDLSNNDLQHIKENAFTKNTKLLKINLSGNKNLEFPKYSTLLITNIEELNISNCGIKKLPQQVFDGLRYLKTIDLSGNPLKKKGLDITSLNTIEAIQKIILPTENRQLINDLCENFNITIEINNKHNKIPTVKCTDYTNEVEKDSQEESNEQTETENKEDKTNVETPAANLSIDAPQLSESEVKLIETNPAVYVDANSNIAPQAGTKTDPKAGTFQEVKGEDVAPESKVVKNEPELEPRQNNDKIEKSKSSPETINPKVEPRISDEDNSKSTNIEVGVPPNVAESVDKPHLEPRKDNDNPAHADEHVDASKPESADSNVNSMDIGSAAIPNGSEPDEKGDEKVQPQQSKSNNEDEQVVDHKELNEKKTEDENPQSQKTDDKVAVKAQAGGVNQIIPELAKPKEAEWSAAAAAQPKKSEKMQNGTDPESGKVGEVTAEASNTGSTILIVLVIAVVVAGIAAFGYKFYKNRTTRNPEPVERELKEIVTSTTNRPDSTQDVIEQEPLMNHLKKENGETKTNNSTGENIGKSLNAHAGKVNTLNSTGPYMPTTTTFKPESTNDGKM